MGEAEVEKGLQTQTETETQTQTQKKNSTDSVEPRQGQEMYYKGRPAHDPGRRGSLRF